MCEKRRRLRALVSERLSAATEEIFALVETTIAEYEEELRRSREENQRNQRLLDSALRPQVRLHRTEDFLGTETVGPGELLVKTEPEKSTLAPESNPQPAQNLHPHVKVKEDTPETIPQQERPTADENETARLQEEPITDENETARLQEEPITDENDTARLQEEPIADENDTTRLQEEPITDENDTARLQEEPIADENDTARLQEEPITDENDTTRLQEEPITDDNETATEDWAQPWQPPVELEEGCGFNLNQSQTSDTTQRTYASLKTCPICDKTLKGDLWSHMWLHTGQRPYSCSVCKKGFTRRQTLTQHTRHFHMKHEQKQKECGNSKHKKTKHTAQAENFSHRQLGRQSETSSKFSSANRKRKQETQMSPGLRSNSSRVGRFSVTYGDALLHTGERPFRCSVCGKDAAPGPPHEREAIETPPPQRRRSRPTAAQFKSTQIF